MKKSIVQFYQKPPLFVENNHEKKLLFSHESRSFFRIIFKYIICLEYSQALQSRSRRTSEQKEYDNVLLEYAGIAT